QNSAIHYFQLPHLPEISSRHRLIAAAAERDLELVCSSYRHGLRGLMAAVRIYLGAAMEGAVPEDNIRVTLSSFELLARKQDHSIVKPHDNPVDALLEYRKVAVYDRRAAIIPDSIVVWMLDDHFEDHGWRLLLESLLDASRARGF